MMGAYVLGRPMPLSSRALINVASVYLGGGSVKCCSGVMFRSFSFSPSVNDGRHDVRKLKVTNARRRGKTHLIPSGYEMLVRNEDRVQATTPIARAMREELEPQEIRLPSTATSTLTSTTKARSRPSSAARTSKSGSPTSRRPLA